MCFVIISKPRQESGNNKENAKYYSLRAHKNFLFIFFKGGYSDGVAHNQTTGTAVGIAHLVVSFIEIVTCITGVRISWKIMTSSINAVSPEVFSVKAKQKNRLYYTFHCYLPSPSI